MLIVRSHPTATIVSVDDRDAVIWLHRRAGFGVGAAELDAAVANGPAAELARLVDPNGAGGPPATDPWDDGRLPLDRRDKPSRLYAVATWLDLMTTSDQPVVERIAWLWHGHFVSGFDKVKIAKLMVDQIRLFRSAGLGPFATLLRDVTIDPAMMLYLDLRTSTGSEPNENYAREVLELFTLGVGNYAEADVQAGARALTGWVLADQATAHFVAKRHADTPQQYLAAPGVHDLDTVVTAIAAQPAMATFVARTVALELLGTAPDDLVGQLAAAFTASGFAVRTLVHDTLQAGLSGTTAPLVLGPAPWLVWARRATGAQLTPPMARQQLALLRDAGQIPMYPPNVAGWPGGPAWFASATMVARTNLAVLVARATPDGPVLRAATGDDPDALAASLGLSSTGFGAATATALAAAAAGAPRLAVALASPEAFVI